MPEYYTEPRKQWPAIVPNTGDLLKLGDYPLRPEPMIFEAINNPGKLIVYYSEYMGSEHQTWCIYDAASKTLRTNKLHCPDLAGHYRGHICEICGRKG